MGEMWLWGKKGCFHSNTVRKINFWGREDALNPSQTKEVTELKKPQSAGLPLYRAWDGGMFSSQWAVYFKFASRSIFIKPRRTGVQKSLAVPGPWGTGYDIILWRLSKLRMKVGYSAHFQSEIFLGLCWRHQIQKHLVTNGLGYLQVYAGAGSGNPQNCHIVRRSSVGSDTFCYWLCCKGCLLFTSPFSISQENTGWL